MNRLICFLLINLFISVSLSAGEAYYHKVVAENGDGVYSLLRRYQLVEEYCNIRQFYKLNHLKKDAQLLAGKRYYIPILIYKYNGESIRSTIGNNDWDRAVAIQKYNEDLLSKKIRTSSYRENKLLWVPFNALYCGKKAPILASENNTSPQSQAPKSQVKSTSSERLAETVPPKKTTPSLKQEKRMDVYTIFGSKYANYEIVDQSLKDKVFYIVAGHGGPDPGAVCKTCPSQLCEDEYAYDVSLRLARNLMQHGAKVEIIIQDNNDGIRDEKYFKCDKDEHCGGKPIPIKQKKRLAQRANRINMLHTKYRNKGYKDHMVICIHVDAAGTSARKDVFFYHHKNSKKGKQTALNIHNTFKRKYDKFQKGRGYKGTVRSRGLYMINHTNPPIVFIELANIQNPNDRQRIIKKSNRQALANWIFEGLIK